MPDFSASPSQEPEVKYLVEYLCEAYQDGLDIWASPVQHLAFGEDVNITKELRTSFETGCKVLEDAYMSYYKRAGEHFARGDCMYTAILKTDILYKQANNIAQPLCKLTSRFSFAY